MKRIKEESIIYKYLNKYLVDRNNYKMRKILKF